MFKKTLLLGVVAGLLSGLACFLYSEVYYWANAYMIDFSTVANTAMLFSVCVFVCVLAAIGFWLLDKLFGSTGRIIFGFLFTIVSFATIISPFAVTLPLELEFPEMFPGFAVPMHFFPALIWMTLQPLFIKS